MPTNFPTTHTVNQTYTFAGGIGTVTFGIA